MKILFLLFAVVFLVFQTQTEATAVANNEAETEAQDQVDEEAQDGVMPEDVAPEISSDRGRFLRPTVCQIGGGVCRRRCLSYEYPSGRCFTEMYCCKRR